MFYNLLAHLPQESTLQVQELRAIIAFTSSFLISLLTIKYFLKIINNRNICRQPIRKDGPKSHLQTKKNTPTMGGLMIILATSISTILFADLSNDYIQIICFGFLTFGIIGFIDDYMKVTGKNSRGFKGAFKLVIQFIIVSIILIWLQSIDQTYSLSCIAIPYSLIYLNLGIFYIIFAALVIVGTANAVNLTDGLDGLVSVPVLINLMALILIIYAVSNPQMATKLQITNIKNSGELAIFCWALSGAVLGFLCFNLKPAKIFMGDVGSLAIGGSLGVLAVILKQELVFALITLLFVIEALSVILQVASYKLRGKRIFLMAPIHHHFEKLGWREQKVVKVFWLASLVFSIIGFLGILI
jgi:phospho-N-acetylmuramoyl-pentapeptide-transferase